jgi:hypothetical protein
MFKYNRFAGHAIRVGALIAVMAALVILPLGAAAKSNGPIPNGTLVVQTSDSRSGALLSGAVVQVKDENGSVVAAGLTNATGRYQVDLAPGAYKLMVSLKNYSVAGADALVAMGQVSHVDILLTSTFSNPPPVPVPGPCCSPAPTGFARITR